MASLSQAVPGRDALLVEFPGYVRDADAAVQRLGGAEAVAAAAAGQAPYLNFHFRPGDPLAHPLGAEKHPTQGLLLRIARTPTIGAGLPGAGGGELRAEVVACVTSSVRFGGLADFQYVSHDARPASEQAPSGESPFGVGPAPLLLPPQLFTKPDVPQDYAFRSFYAGDPDHMKQGTNTGRINVGKGRIAAHVINFENVNVLPPLTDPGAEEAGLFKERRESLRAAAALFAARPMWSAAALKARVPALVPAEADILLPRLAYVFRNGPWKGLYIKRGYDPRTNPAAGVHQAIEQEAAAAGQKPAAGAAPNYRDICSFARLPVPSSSPLQLSDLQDTQLQALLQQALQRSTCDIDTGWFTAEAWQQLQARVAARFGPLQAAAKPGAPGQAAPMASDAPASSSAASAAQQPPPAPSSVAAVTQQAAGMDISLEPDPPAAGPSSQPAAGVAAGQPAPAAPAAEQAPDQARGSRPPSAEPDQASGIVPADYMRSILDAWPRSSSAASAAAAGAAAAAAEGAPREGSAPPSQEPSQDVGAALRQQAADGDFEIFEDEEGEDGAAPEQDDGAGVAHGGLTEEDRDEEEEEEDESD